MPLDETTRFFLEVAIVSYLKGKKEATSKEILYYLTKRRYRVRLGMRQVAEVCTSLKRRGALLSRLRRKIALWRINPNFYREHPNQSMYLQSMTLEEFKEAIKRRTKRRLKAKNSGTLHM
jgi:hypothetical protein